MDILVSDRGRSEAEAAPPLAPGWDLVREIGIVLRAGRIIEIGTHADPVRVGGEYACAWEAQAQSYH